MKKYRYTDKSVRDESQTAVLKGRTITIYSRFGRRIALKYEIKLGNYLNPKGIRGNLAYKRHEFIRRKLTRVNAENYKHNMKNATLNKKGEWIVPREKYKMIYDTTSPYFQRIIDSQVSAINQVIENAKIHG